MKRNKQLLSLATALLFLPIMTVPSAAEDSQSITGDVNLDGTVSEADAALLQDCLLGTAVLTPQQAALADVNQDDHITIFDLGILKAMLHAAAPSGKTIYAATTEELLEALAAAAAGDTILLAPGIYECSEYGTKSALFYSDAEGTASAPITIRSTNPDEPAILCGTDTAKGIVLYLTGDYWIVDSIVCCNAQKGIVLDHSNYSVIQNAEVYQTGQEGIHLRDGSSYCQVLDSAVHDNGLVSEYGEAIYIGSAKSTSGYDYNCDYNLIQGCTLGPNTVAESVDIKEYTTGNIIENCIMYGGGMTATDSFVDIKGNETIVRNNQCDAQGNTAITDAFQLHCQVEGWGCNNEIYGNTVTFSGETEYLVRSWSGTSCTVWDNVRIPDNADYLYRAYSGSTITIAD